MSEIVLRSPAKLNLSLRVFRPRPDGYHPIVSVFHEIGLADFLTIRYKPGQGNLTLISEAPNIPLDSRNLIAKAVGVFAPWNTFDLTVHIEKNIPMGGGLGGGSSNAGVVLRWLNELLGRPLSDQQLSAEALRLGADVPFFLVNGTALVSGIGEIVQSISITLPPYFVLIIPPLSILSADIYKAFDQIVPSAGDPPATPMVPEMGINDLLPAVLVRNPEMEQLINKLTPAALGPVFLSGSGATLYIPCNSESEAKQVARAVSLELPDCRIEVTSGSVC